ncbi:permease [Clostridium sp. Sa3CUN1]|uniref:Permease n=1 Tax=Clostridium gallinarum TaxID=2762246 RepID=A0ABR8Q7W4_9CLOT|nr:permease [Clostridium gallinarum]MBD7916522.1 permease [Clostridium gallinarum]
MIKWANIFISMILEALPFIIIGSIISSTIQLFISEERVKKILPKSRFVSIIFAALFGVFIPICECAIVPIARSLIKKGVPIAVAIVFMLSVPIVNPIVILSTFYAFNDIRIVLIRALGGIISAIVIGVLIEFFTNKKEEVIKVKSQYENICDCGCEVGDYFYNKSKIRLCLEHASKEFFNILRYYIFGSFLSSIFIVILKEEILNNYNKGVLMPIILMMLLSFLLSLCSEADAFIGKSFSNYFGVPAISAFLIIGPMLDLKNAILISSYFKKSFAIKLFLLIILVVIGFSMTLTLVYS